MRNRLYYIICISVFFSYFTYAQSPLFSGTLVSDTGTNNNIGNANTSRNVAVDFNGHIYVVYANSSEIRIAKSINGGQSFLPSVLVANANLAEPELAINDSGYVFVAWNENLKVNFSSSTDGGSSFNSSISFGNIFKDDAIHMSTYGDNVYLIDQSATNLYFNNTNGVGQFEVTPINTSMVYADVLTDQNGIIYTPMDSPQLRLFKSVTEGTTLTEIDLNSEEFVYFSSYSLSDGPCGTYIFVAGGGDLEFEGSRTLGYKIDVNTGQSTEITFGENSLTLSGRTLYADNKGTLIDGYRAGNGDLMINVSSDQGESFNTPILVASGESHNIARSPITDNIIVTYQKNNQIFLSVYDNLLKNIQIPEPNPPLSFCPGDTFNLSFNISGIFNAGTVLSASLSDTNGDFSNAIEIGTITTNTSGEISCTLPSTLSSSTKYRIQIESLENCIQSNSITLTIGEAVITGASEVCLGNTTQLTGSGTPNSTNPWTSSNTNIATINNQGLVSALAVGNTVITYSTNNGCSNTFSIVVNASSTPIFNQIDPICKEGSFSLPTTSTNGISGSWLPAINNQQTTNYTFTPDSGECATTTTMTVVVNEQASPTFTQITPICEGGNINLPTTSTDGISGSCLPVINNQQTTTYTFTPDSGECATTTTMTVVVNQQASPTFTQIAPICEGGNINLPTTSTNGITGSWLPAINNQQTTTYTFTPDSGECATTTTMTVVVNEETTPTFTQITPICKDGNISLPMTSTNGITGSWLPVINNQQTTTYTFTPDSEECIETVTMTVVVNQPATPTFTQIAPICIDGNINLPTTSTNGISGSWLPAINNQQTTTYTFTPDSGECVEIATMTVVVNQPATPTFTQITPICKDGNINLPTTSTDGISGSWLPAINNQQTTNYTFTPDSGECATTTTMTVVVNEETTPTFTQITPICKDGNISLPMTSTNGITGSWLPVINNQQTTTYTFTPDSEECIETVTMTVVVNQPATPTFTQIAPICIDGNINLPTTSTNGISGSWLPAINNQQTTTYTFTPDSGECVEIATMTVVVNQPATPTFTQITPICKDGNINLPTTSTDGISGSWLPAINNQQTTNYTFTPDSGECATTTTMTVVVNQQASPTFTQIAPICEGGNINLPTTSTNGITGSWLPVINNQQTTTYTFTPDSGGCEERAIMTVNVNQSPRPTLTNGSICVENITNETLQSYTIESGLNTTDYNFEWYFNTEKINNATSNTLEVSNSGNYSLIAINKLTGCRSEITTTTITATFPATSIIYDIEDLFTGNSTISISVIPATIPKESLRYQLNDGLFQESNIFTNLKEGLYNIKVIDIDGCTELEEEITILSYPKFFTPNNDGVNDTWNIAFFTSNQAPKIYIYNRYGKLISKLDPLDKIGWDGTFFGKKLPSTDYWFVVNYLENGIQKTFKSHFTLLRK